MDEVTKEIAAVEGPGQMYSDIYNSDVFVSLWKDKLRWSKDYGGWLMFNGKYWQKDTNDRIKWYAMKTHAHLIDQIAVIKDKKFFTHVRNSAAENRLNAMISCSKPHLGALPEEFDREQFFFNCQNTIVDLRTGIKIPHSPHALMTRIANTDYDADAQCPLWLKFLNDIFLGNQQIIDFMQRAIGYSLSGDVREQCLFILYGTGRNGKSIFLGVIGHMLGDYAMNCPASTFIKKGNAVTIPNDIARLKGIRFVTALENNQNVSFDESMIKNITGGTDKISARFLGKEFFDFLATFKIFLSTNHKPNIRGTDPGIWRRIKMIPFNFRVTDENDDKDLFNKLKAESAGILNWAIEGHRKWQEGGLCTPLEIRSATDKYRDEEDIIGQFISDFCVKEKDGWISVNEFKDKLSAVIGFRVSQKQIAAYMETHEYKNDDNRKTINGSTIRVYNNIRWANVSEQTGDGGWSE